MSQIEIENALLQLPLKTRAELAHKLLVSLDEPNQSELEISWALEADRRILAAEQGEMKRYSKEEMLERVKNALSWEIETDSSAEDLIRKALSKLRWGSRV